MIGTIITAPDGRHGRLLARTATGDYVCADAAGTFLVPRPKAKPPKKVKAPKAKRAWQPSAGQSGGPMNPEILAIAARVKAREAVAATTPAKGAGT